MSDISFILTYCKDTEERIKNFNHIINYYTGLYEGSEFIVVETGDKQTLTNSAKYTLIFKEHTTPFNKSKAYNHGLSLAKNDIVCFLDVDCIVSKESLDKAIEKSKLNPNIYIGYNGTCLYLDYSVKVHLKDKNLYQEISDIVDHSKLYINFKNEKYFVANTKAVGGCLVGRKKVFEEINGFNPHIVGWGYEDNEIVLRAQKLGYYPHFVKTSKPLLFHLPHHSLEIDRSAHPTYNSNGEVYAKINKLSKEEILEYIKSWKLTW